jgi:hypothetical protein
MVLQEPVFYAGKVAAAWVRIQISSRRSLHGFVQRTFSARAGNEEPLQKLYHPVKIIFETLAVFLHLP